MSAPTSPVIPDGSAAQQSLPHTVSRLEWLGACVPQPDAFRSEWMRLPFVLGLDGAPWSCATDGAVLLALRGAEAGLVTPPDLPSRVAGLLTATAPIRLVAAWSDVEMFLSDATVETSVPCRRCNGAAPEPTKCVRCDGEGEIECGECGHEKECRECDGHGYIGGCKGCEGDKTNRPEPKPGQIAPGVAVDRNRLKRALGPLQAAPITVAYSSSLEPVMLEDDSRTWRIVIMPMSEQPPTELPVLLGKLGARS